MKKFLSACLSLATITALSTAAFADRDHGRREDRHEQKREMRLRVESKTFKMNRSQRRTSMKIVANGKNTRLMNVIVTYRNGDTKTFDAKGAAQFGIPNSGNRKIVSVTVEFTGRNASVSMIPERGRTWAMK